MKFKLLLTLAGSIALAFSGTIAAMQEAKAFAAAAAVQAEKKRRVARPWDVAGKFAKNNVLIAENNARIKDAAEVAEVDRILTENHIPEPLKKFIASFMPVAGTWAARGSIPFSGAVSAKQVNDSGNVVAALGENNLQVAMQIKNGWFVSTILSLEKEKASLNKDIKMNKQGTLIALSMSNEVWLARYKDNVWVFDTKPIICMESGLVTLLMSDDGSTIVGVSITGELHIFKNEKLEKIVAAKPVGQNIIISGNGNVLVAWDVQAAEGIWFTAMEYAESAWHSSDWLHRPIDSSGLRCAIGRITMNYAGTAMVVTMPIFRENDTRRFFELTHVFRKEKSGIFKMQKHEAMPCSLDNYYCNLLKISHENRVFQIKSRDKGFLTIEQRYCVQDKKIHRESSSFDSLWLDKESVAISDAFACIAGQIRQHNLGDLCELALFTKTKFGWQTDIVASGRVGDFTKLALTQGGIRLFALRDSHVQVFDNLVAPERNAGKLTSAQLEFINGILGVNEARFLFSDEEITLKSGVTRVLSTRCADQPYNAEFAEENFELLKSLPWPIIKILLAKRVIKLSAAQRETLKKIKHAYDHPETSSTAATSATS